MKFSRSQIDKAGETIMSSKVGKEYDAAYTTKNPSQRNVARDFLG